MHKKKKHSVLNILRCQQVPTNAYAEPRLVSTHLLHLYFTLVRGLSFAKNQPEFLRFTTNFKNERTFTYFSLILSLPKICRGEKCGFAKGRMRFFNDLFYLNVQYKKGSEKQ